MKVLSLQLPMLPVTSSYWAFHKGKGMYTIHNLHLLATHFCMAADYWSRTAIHWATSHFDSLVKCTLSFWVATMLHILCIHSAFDNNRDTNWCLSKALRGVLSSYITQMETAVGSHWSSAKPVKWCYSHIWKLPGPSWLYMASVTTN